MTENVIVELSLLLFGKPAWELPDLEGAELSADYAEKLIKLGEEIRQRMYEVARVFKILVENGWEAYGTLYDITLTKDVSLEEAKKELKNLGLEEWIGSLRELELDEEE